MTMAYGEPNFSVSWPRLAKISYIMVLSSVLASPHTASHCSPFCIWKVSLVAKALSPTEPWQGEGAVFQSIPKSTFQAASKSCSRLLYRKTSVCHVARLGESVLHEWSCWSSEPPPTLSSSFSPVRGRLSSRRAELEMAASSVDAASFGSRWTCAYLRRVKFPVGNEARSFGLGARLPLECTSGLVLPCRGTGCFKMFFLCLKRHVD